MQISVKWLKEYIDFDFSTKQLEEYLTFAGIEVEAVHEIGRDVQPVIVSEVRSCERIEGSDHLTQCRVFTGTEELSIVCGAPNVRTGVRVPLAPIGTRLGEIEIKKAKLRGVESYGMLCSERELGISEDHSGLLILPDDAPLGVSVVDYLGIRDTVIEVEITPNRPDLLGMIGIARDLSALLQLPLHLPAGSVTVIPEAIGTYLALENQAPDGCPRYLARVIRNVKIGESPEWLKRHLQSIGLRPINNVVDITNFVMMEYGHPLHAFDYDLLHERRIVVRRATAGEKFPALDNHEYELCEDDLVIADGNKPVALAGVIGGANSCITDNTTNIVLESACFEYGSIRRTSYRYKIFTDSSYRFERNLSPEMASVASQRAAALIQLIAGGEVCDQVLDSYPMPKPTWTVSLRPERVRSFLAIDIDNSTIISYLQALGLRFAGETTRGLQFEIPDTRKDLTREIDLIEEIIRLYGYNRTERVPSEQTIMNWPDFRLRRKVQDHLVANGYFEVLNTSFTDPELLAMLRITEQDKRYHAVKLKNPQTINTGILRTTLLPQLIRNAIYNIHHGEENIRIFELNHVYFPREDGFADEPYRVAGLATGAQHTIHWRGEKRDYDFHDLKGCISDLLEACGVKDVTYQASCEPYLVTEKALSIWSGDNYLGAMGLMDPKILSEFGLDISDFKQDVWVFDLSTDLIRDIGRETVIRFRELPRFPYIRRDISFLVKKSVQSADLIQSIRSCDERLIRKVEIFDIYQDKKFASDLHSMSITIVFGSDEKTLTDDLIESIFNQIVRVLHNEYQIEMR